MTHKLVFDEQAIKSLEKLPKNVSERIMQKLLQTRSAPFRYFKKLTQIPQFSLRVGSYRVIAGITATQIQVLYIDHRRRVYKK